MHPPRSLADLLASVVPPDLPVVAGVEPEPGRGVRLTLHPLTWDDRGVPHPLWGLCAPETWWGSCLLLPLRAAAAPLVVVVPRHGPVEVAGPSPSGSPARSVDGLAIDCLHRSLGRPSPPLDDGPGVWMAARWCAEVLDHVLDTPPTSSPARVGPPFPRRAERLIRSARRLSWDGMAEELGMSTERDLEDPDGAVLGVVRQELGGVLTGLPAHWLDGPVLGRFLLAQVPPLDDLLEALRSVMHPGDADEVESVVGAVWFSR